MDVKSDRNRTTLRRTAEDAITLVADVYPGSERRRILLLHGFWRGRRHPAILRIASELGRSGATVIVPDLRGHGESGGRFTFTRMEGRDVGAFADLLNPAEDLRIVALSIGAAVALAASAAHIVNPRRLLLISPVADVADLGPDILEMVRGRHIDREQRHWVPRVELRSLLSVYEKADPVALSRQLTCGVTLVHAERDWLVHHRHSLALAAACGNTELILLNENDGRRMHADRLVSHAWPILGPLLRRFTAEG